MSEGLHDRAGAAPVIAFLSRRKPTEPDQEPIMNMNYDLARTEIAARLQHAQARRSAKHARTRQGPARRPRWQWSRYA